MGTGVGEAMLIGAAVGGGSSALMGGDPIKGAMLGAAGGGLGAGLGAAAGASGSLGSAAGGAGGVGAGGAAGGAAGVGAGSSVLAGSANPALYSSLGTGTGAGAGTFGTFSAGAGALPTTVTPIGLSAGTGALPTAAGAGSGISIATPGTLGGASLTNLGFSPTVAGYTPGMYASGAAAMPGGVASLPGNFTGMAPALSNTKLGLIAGGGALSGMMDAERKKFGVPGEEDYVNSFDSSKFRRSEPTYAPEGVYRPEYKTYAAEGGIMRLAVGGSVDDEMGGDYSAMGTDQGNLRKGLFGLG